MDLNRTAFRIVQSLTAENKGASSRNAMKAGRVGGKARAEKLSRERRREIALDANRARWQKAR